MPSTAKALLLTCALALGAPPVYAATAKEPTIDKSASVVKWVKERVKSAADKKPELVRFPIVGCLNSATCPTNWAIGFPEQMEEDQDGRWIIVVPEAGLKLPPFGEVGGVADWAPTLLVEGYFTGVKRMPTEDEGIPEAAESKLPEFHVLRFSTASKTRAERTLKIVATGEEALKPVDPFPDDKAWLVLVSSKPLFDAGSEKISGELKDKLVAAGFSDAEVFDSRKAKNLFCCYLSVVAGRYKTKEEAQEVTKKVKEKGFDAYTKQGW